MKSSERPSSRSAPMLLAPALCAFLAFGAGSAMADEVLVCTSAQEDIEFDHTDALFEWVDKGHNLWIGQVDTTTGQFIPSSGMGTKVDTNVTYSGTFGNGPEWVQSTAGFSMVYNKFNPPAKTNSGTASQTYIAKATLKGSTWTVPTWKNNSLGFVEPEGDLNPT